MDKYIHSTIYNWRNYSSMLWLKLNYVSKDTKKGIGEIGKKPQQNTKNNMCIFGVLHTMQCPCLCCCFCLVFHKVRFIKMTLHEYRHIDRGLESGGTHWHIIYG